MGKHPTSGSAPDIPQWRPVPSRAVSKGTAQRSPPAVTEREREGTAQRSSPAVREREREGPRHSTTEAPSAVGSADSYTSSNMPSDVHLRREREGTTPSTAGAPPQISVQPHPVGPPASSNMPSDVHVRSIAVARGIIGERLHTGQPITALVDVSMRLAHENLPAETLLQIRNMLVSEFVRDMRAGVRIEEFDRQVGLPLTPALPGSSRFYTTSLEAACVKANVLRRITRRCNKKWARERDALAERLHRVRSCYLESVLSIPNMERAKGPVTQTHPDSAITVVYL
ncbi:hypothetical protein KIPB_010941 [Kipferlia bialata]|uniref:Uncharacterized protein n=1 Tax=Kipferlia bialata TaxID=797122 RepID=A0A9K3D420_9EUKA|nr:hypothetical protein KIPB_010941 [Kipferlia bialata]|eukprot:g10941.t1